MYQMKYTQELHEQSWQDDISNSNIQQLQNMSDHQLSTG